MNNIEVANSKPVPVRALADVPQVISVGFDTLAGFELTQRIANMFSKSSLMPKEFQGNLGNCAIALNMAARMGADPLMVAQNLYVVHGRPGWSSQFLIATFNACGRFSAIRYEFKGQEGTDEWSCRAWAIEKETGERIEGAWVSIGLAKKEGWYSKNGSKWQSMPQQMLQYRAASWFIRAYAPEIAMGLKTAEEVQDAYDMEDDGRGVFSVSSTDDLAAKVQAAAEPQNPKRRRSTEERVAEATAIASPQGQEHTQEEPRESVPCPNDMDEDGQPQRVYTTYCEGKACKATCPSWQG